jgi:hypothetical protein
MASSVLKNPLAVHYFVVSRLKMLIYWHINSAFSPSEIRRLAPILSLRTNP